MAWRIVFSNHWKPKPAATSEVKDKVDKRKKQRKSKSNDVEKPKEQKLKRVTTSTPEPMELPAEREYVIYLTAKYDRLRIGRVTGVHDMSEEITVHRYSYEDLEACPDKRHVDGGKKMETDVSGQADQPGDNRR